jgi:ATP-dependent RNA helicase RhlE
MVPEDYIHRVGRTARAEATGDAFTFVAPEEEGELRDIERVLGKRLPRVTVPDFDYRAKPEVTLEVPLAERIAGIRARKAEERARAKEKAARRAAQPGATATPAARSERPRPSARGRTPKGRRP